MDLDGHLSHLYVRTWSTMLALWIFIQADHQSLLWPANDSFIVPYTDYTVVPIYGVYIYSSMLLRMKTWSNFVAACNLRHIVAEEWIGCIQCCCAVPRFCALRSGPPPGNYPGKSPVEDDASFQDVLHWKVDMFPIVSHEPCVVFAWTYVFFLEHVMSGSHCQLAAR